MDRAVAVEVTVARQVEVYHYTGDDGYPAAAVFSPVGITLADGRMFILPQGVKRYDHEEGMSWWGARYETDAMIARIEAAGRQVDLAHWVEMEPFDLEAELEAEWEREQFERGYSL